MKSPRIIKQETGAGIVEYGLIVALIAIVSLTSVAALGAKTSGSLTASAQSISHEDNADAETTTTTDPGVDAPTTTSPADPGSGSGGDGGGEEGSGDPGSGGPGPTTTTTAPETTTTTAPETTTTTQPTKPQTAVAEASGVAVTYGYVDGKVVVLATKLGNNAWKVKVVQQTDHLIEHQFTHPSGRVVITVGSVDRSGELTADAKAL